MVLKATCSSRKAPVEAMRNVMRADDGREDAGRTMGGAFEQALDGERALAPDEMIELADDLAAHRLGAEHHAGDRRRDQQDRCDREQRVKGERRAEPGAVIVPPRAARASDGSQDHGLAHQSTMRFTPLMPVFNSELLPPVLAPHNQRQ